MTYIPNWITLTSPTSKTLQYNDIALSDFMPIQKYDPTLLLDSGSDTSAINERYTYITPYMGSYRENFKEYDGSHL